MPIAAREITLRAGHSGNVSAGRTRVRRSRALGQIGWNGGYSGRHMAW
jgi:hypothetical protein